MLQLIGRYRVRERIGEGAMADVYRAFDPSIDRELAIKVLKAELRQNPEYVARFLREARAAGALSHPSIVTIYDVGEAEGYPYIAMELLEGEALDVVLKRQPQLPAGDVLAIGIQLADALAYAHGCGVVHRDIKPSNIVLGRDGRSAKILDFGIARLSQSTGDHETESLKTQIGQVMGTPRYMSPEQVLGGDIDGRSDLFSTGVVLYEMITGRRAFNASSAATLALQIIREDPRPMGELVRQTPAGLQFVISKLLAKRPERRFADGAELAAALRREEQAIAAASADTRGRRYLPMQIRLAAAMAAVTGVVLTASVWGVLDRQYEAMERMALSSGSAIATFVASNASLSAVENAGLPSPEQDWAPVTAFVQGAASDPNVRQMMVVDAGGVIQASTRPELVGRLYRPASGEPVVRRVGAVVATDTGESAAEGGFRFVRPIQYAGRSFGLVDVTISKAELASAARLSMLLMAALAIIVTAVVGLVSFAGARLLAQPLMRLKAALKDAASTGAGLRISHDRRDEFGELFDGFNAFSQTVQDRLERAEGAAPLAPSVTLDALLPAAFADEATRIGKRVEAVLERTCIVEADPDTLRTVLHGAPAPKGG